MWVNLWSEETLEQLLMDLQLVTWEKKLWRCGPSSSQVKSPFLAGSGISVVSGGNQESRLGRKLLQEVNNSSLEEEESKNCTAPGKTGWKKEDSDSLLQR